MIAPTASPCPRPSRRRAAVPGQATVSGQRLGAAARPKAISTSTFWPCRGRRSFARWPARGERFCECAPGAHPGFVVHGLWPQMSSGYARRAAGDRPLCLIQRPVALARSLCRCRPRPSRMAGPGRPVWQESDRLFRRCARRQGAVVIPPQLKAPSQDQTLSPLDVQRAFFAANPACRPGMMTVTCQRGRFRRRAFACPGTCAISSPCPEGPRADAPPEHERSRGRSAGNELSARIPRRQFRRRPQTRPARARLLYLRRKDKAVPLHRHPRRRRALRSRRPGGGCARARRATAFDRLRAATLPAPAAELVAPYLDIVQAPAESSIPARRKSRRTCCAPRTGPCAANCCRRRPQTCARALGRDRRIKVIEIDGYQGLNAFVPPPERRGLVLIDPPFERRDEYERAHDSLSRAPAQMAGRNLHGLAAGEGARRRGRLLRAPSAGWRRRCGSTCRSAAPGRA